jgi:hypothetical protein
MSAASAGSRGSAVLVGLVCLALGVNYIRLGIAPTQVVAVGEKYRLPIMRGAKVSLAPGLSDKQLRQAVRAAPLDQVVVNAAMVSSIAQAPTRDAKPWLRVVGSLGWRDPTTQQNIIAAAIQREDVPAIVNSADALLRVGALFREAAAVMNLAEADPQTWSRVFALLRSNVSWRHAYLGQASGAMLPAVLDGRIKTITMLQQNGDRPNRDQVRPLVAALSAAGRGAEADRIWRDYTGDHANLLHDVRFERALAQADQPLTPLTFDWSFDLEAGYTTDIAPTGLGGSIVSLQWDGRGIPVFFSQQTSAVPGDYTLRIRVDGDTQIFGERVGFRLRCGPETVEFVPTNRPGSVELVLQTVKSVACSLPTLEAYGRVGKNVQAFEGALTAISMSASAASARPAKKSP